MLANKVDSYGLGLYTAVPNAVLSGTTDKWKSYLQAGAKLADNGCPMDGTWRAILNQWEQVEVVNELKGLFQSSEQIKSQYERGVMGTQGGLDWFWDQNVSVHTAGPLGGAPLYQPRRSRVAPRITVSGFTAAAALRVKKGDIFTMALVNGVNPVSLQTTGKLRQFTATADVNSRRRRHRDDPDLPADHRPVVAGESAPDGQRAADGGGAADVPDDGEYGVLSEHRAPEAGVRHGHVPLARAVFRAIRLCRGPRHGRGDSHLEGVGYCDGYARQPRR